MLIGDLMLNMICNVLVLIVVCGVDGGGVIEKGNGYVNLLLIGIKFEWDGMLNVDSVKFDSVLFVNLLGVVCLFNLENGIGMCLVD